MFSYRGINARPLATILWTRQNVTSAWLCLKLGVAKCPCTPTRLGTQKAHKHKHFMGISLPNMGYSRPMCPTPMSVLSETPADSTDADGQLPLRIASFSGLCGVRGICLLQYMVLREMLAPGGRFATCCLAWHVCVVETCRTLALLAPVHSLATVNLSGSPLYNRNLALRRFVLNWVLNAKTLNFLHTHTHWRAELEQNLESGKRMI